MAQPTPPSASSRFKQNQHPTMDNKNNKETNYDDDDFVANNSKAECTEKPLSSPLSHRHQPTTPLTASGLTDDSLDLDAITDTCSRSSSRRDEDEADSSDADVDASTSMSISDSMAMDSVMVTPMTHYRLLNDTSAVSLSPTDLDNFNMSMLGSPTDDDADAGAEDSANYIAIDVELQPTRPSAAKDESFNHRQDRNSMLQRALFEKAMAYKQGVGANVNAGGEASDQELPLQQQPQPLIAGTGFRVGQQRLLRDTSLTYSESDRNSLFYSQSTMGDIRGEESMQSLFSSNGEVGLALSNHSHSQARLSAISDSSGSPPQGEAADAAVATEKNVEAIARDSSLRGMDITMQPSTSSHHESMEGDEEQAQTNTCGGPSSSATTGLFGGLTLTLKATKSERFQSSLDAPLEGLGNDDGEEDTCPGTLSSNSMFTKSPPNSPQNDNDNEDDDNAIVCTHPMLSKQDFLKAKARIWCNTFKRFPFLAQICLVVAFVSFIIAFVFVVLTIQDKIRSKAAIEP
jgi:hypothetical protein